MVERTGHPKVPFYLFAFCLVQSSGLAQFRTWDLEELLLLFPGGWAHARLLVFFDTPKLEFERVFHEKHPSSWHPGFGADFLSTLLHECFYFQYALVIITIER